MNENCVTLWNMQQQHPTRLLEGAALGSHLFLAVYTVSDSQPPGLILCITTAQARLHMRHSSPLQPEHGDLIVLL